MPRFERSKLQEFQAWLFRRQKAVGKALQARWIRHGLRGTRRAIFRTQQRILQWLFPKWLKSTTKTVQRGIRKAEVKVSQTGQTVGKSVAKSAVGSKAKKLARVGRVMEFRFFKFFVEGAKFIGAMLRDLMPPSVRRFFRRLGLGLWKVFGVFFVFFGRWFRTRKYWQLVGGVPAFVLALPLAYCMVKLPFYTPERKAKHYRLEAHLALESQSYETADLYYRKLAQLGQMNEGALYQSALTRFRSGEEEAAVEEMRRLAPDGRPGFPPAHIWLARHYLSGNSNLPANVADARGRGHLSYALQRDPDSAEARALRAQVMRRDGQLDEALMELRRVVKRIPAQGLMLADLYLSQGKWQQAREEVVKLRDLYNERQANGGELAAYEYLAWSYAFVILGDLATTEEKLLEGHDKYPDDKPLRDRLYEVLIQRAHRDFRARMGDPVATIDRLLVAWKLRPEDDRALLALSDMTRDENSYSQGARTRVKALLDSNEAPPELYSLTGSALLGDGRDPATAQRYLRRAIELEPRDDYALNNLAFALIQEGNDETLREALVFVERALAIVPGEPAYRETQGQVLLRLGRHQEAIEALQYALNGLGDLPEIHQSLAQAYAAIGNDELAARHRRRATQ